MLDFRDMKDEEKKEYNSEWLKLRGVYLLKIMGNTYSGNIQGYSKTPFVKFDAIDSSTGKKCNLMFWMPTPNDSPDRAEVKKKVLRDFFANLGCDTKKLAGNDLLEDSINKEAKVALKEREIIYCKKETKEPMVVTQLEYYFSGKSNEKLTPKEEKMYVSLNEKQQKQFEAMKAEWDVSQVCDDKPKTQQPPADDLAF